MKQSKRLGAVSLTALLALAAPVAAHAADLIVSMNDNHTTLDADGNFVVTNPMKPDNADIIDLSGPTPKIVASFEVPGSIIGPPSAVWVSADDSWAILTSATKADASGKSGLGPNDQVSVVDLTAKPPKITQSLNAGAGATTVVLSPDGKLALIANRTAGTVSAYTVANKRLTPAGTITLAPGSGASGIVFAKDGKSAIVTRQLDNQIALLHIDGTTITVDKRPITTALAPYTADPSPTGSLVAVSNMGRGDGDTDSVSMIDLSQNPPRAVSITGVASGPEPLKFSPDGKFLAVGAEMGTGNATTNWWYHPHGLLQVFRVDGHNLHLVASAETGRWVEGLAWSRNGKLLLLGDARDHKISVYAFNGQKLTAKPDLIPTGMPVAFGTPWR